MNFVNYPAFRQALITMIDGDDISQSSISVPVLDLIVSVGEQRVYRDVRSTTQDFPYAATTTNNLAPLPVACIEMKSVVIPTLPALTYCPYEVIETLIQVAPTGPARRFSIQGDFLIFYPVQPDGTAITGRYVNRFPDLATSNPTAIVANAFFQRHPDLFLYAALAESGPFIGEVSRLPEWKERYLIIAQSVNETERRRGTRASKLQSRIG